MFITDLREKKFKGVYEIFQDSEGTMFDGAQSDLKIQEGPGEDQVITE